MKNPIQTQGVISEWGYRCTGTVPMSLGDEAYFDPRHGIHVHKGNVRFFLSAGDDEKPLTNLGTQVAGQLAVAVEELSDCSLRDQRSL